MRTKALLKDWRSSSKKLLPGSKWANIWFFSPVSQKHNSQWLERWPLKEFSFWTITWLKLKGGNAQTLISAQPGKHPYPVAPSGQLIVFDSRIALTGKHSRDLLLLSVDLSWPFSPPAFASSTGWKTDMILSKTT